MKRRYFGTDGIRGQSNVFPMTPDLAMRVGIAAGTIFRRGNHRHRVVIGKDTRLSGYMLENAWSRASRPPASMSFILGPIPTPAVAMLTRSLRADLGVMISASHNPYEDNGIKLFGPDGYKLSDDIEAEIEDLLEKDLNAQLAKSDDIGRAKRVDGVHDRYIEHAKRTLPRDVTLQGLRIAIDCANGAAYKVAPAVLWELGAEVVTIGNEPNGTNINLNCGSTSPRRVAEEGRRGARRYRHRARWRCGPRHHRRRERLDRRRRPADGRHRRELGREPAAARQWYRCDRHVQSRPRAFPR